MGKRVPRARSIVGSFSPLPELLYAAGGVVPQACHLALVKPRALPVSMYGAVQNDSSALPLEMSQELWGGLSLRPVATCQRSQSVTDGQIHSFDLHSTTLRVVMVSEQGFWQATFLDDSAAL